MLSVRGKDKEAAPHYKENLSRMELDVFEKTIILEAFSQTKDKKARIAETLDIPRRKFILKIQAYGNV